MRSRWIPAWCTPVLVLATACGGGAGPVAATGPDVEPYGETVSEILRRGLELGGAHERLRSLCETAPHRLAGSPGAVAAVRWAEDEMARIGLENVHREECMVPRWVRGDVERLAVRVGGGDPEELTILALGGSVPTDPGGLTAGVVEVRSFEELRELGASARGKIVFFNRPMEDGRFDTFSAYGRAVDQRSSGALEAAKAGGVAAIVRSMTTRLDDFPHTGAMRSYEDGVERVPAAAISTLGAERLSALIATGGELELELELSCRTEEDVPSYNVIGEIVGRELPDEVVVVGGHLDGWDVGQGAHDDGAGCIHSLEAAAILRALDLRPRRTIRVVMFMNEENGVRGGSAYYADHADEMGSHVMALESDRGGFTPRGFTTDAGPEALGILQSVGALLAPARVDTVEPGYGGVDISPMARSGVPLVGFLPDSQRYFDFHHSERDRVEAVHPRELQLGAAAIAAMLYVVADLEAPLPRNAARE